MSPPVKLPARPEAIRVFIPGRPRSTQTGSVVWRGGRAVPTRRGESWSSYVALVAKQHAPPKLLEGPLVVHWTIRIQRPKKGGYGPAPVAPDYGNALKGVEDALNGIIWRDDRQICHATIRKIYSDQPGLEFSAMEIP